MSGHDEREFIKACGRVARESAEVRRYMAGGSGARACGFDVEPGIDVLVKPTHGADNDRAFEIAKRLTGDAERWSALEGKLVAAQAEAADLRDRVACLQAQIPPKSPVRLLCSGFVRFADAEMWLLGRREHGFASFGVKVDGWDDLFRRYDVRVVAHGRDEHGAWWEVANQAGGK